MKKILMTICLIGGLAMLWSCSDDKDSYPVPSRHFYLPYGHGVPEYLEWYY